MTHNLSTKGLSVLLKESGLTEGAVPTLELLRQWEEDGIAPLAYEEPHHSEEWSRYPADFKNALFDLAHLQTVTQLLRQREVTDLLDALHLRHIAPILIKGFPLSYLIYPSPNLRPSWDIDLLIKPEERDAARRCVADLGYTFPNAVSGEEITHEFSCIRQDAHGVEHALDFHWRISNPALFSNLLTREEMERESLPVPALGNNARTLSLPHALLLACIHRVAHHHDDERRIWLYDIHLLIQKMTLQEALEFLALAKKKKVAAICRRGIELAQLKIGTQISSTIVEKLSEAGGSEASAAYLETNHNISLCAPPGRNITQA